MRNKHGFFKMLVPSATVFISSACIMIIELVASRLIAKHLGSSLYTWTAVIGIVLAGITIGNYIGGRIADKFKTTKALSVIFVLCSTSCVITIILNNTVGNWLFLWQLSWPMRIFSHISIVFLLPSVLLGTISPIVAKMALDKGLPQGRTVGDIYAFGAAGSIAGTFAAGYYLIAAMGTMAIIWTVAAVLLAMSIFYCAKSWLPYTWAGTFLIALFLGNVPAEATQNIGSYLKLREKSDLTIIYEDETPYCYVAVKRISETRDRRAFIQDKLRHSEIVVDDINDLRYFYTNIYAGITHILSENKEELSAMVIGGGGYAFPQYLEKNWPGSNIDVIEIDAGVTKAAYEAFGLSKDTSINTITMDARNYVDELLVKKSLGQSISKYDFIYEDAINDYSVPFQLVTKEFNEKIFQILEEDGIYMVNLIDTYDNGKFLGAMVNTLKETFEHIYVVSSYMSLPSLRDTYVVITSKHQINPQEIFAQYNPDLRLRYLDVNDFNYLNERSGGIVLTDNYAPVENLLTAVVLQGGKSALAERYLIQAEKLKHDQKYDQSIKKYIQAADRNASMTIEAYNEIGCIYANHGHFGKAVQAFEKAINHHYDTGEKQHVIGSLHNNLATVLQRINKPKDAKIQFEKAIEQFKIEVAEHPDSHKLWTKLGDTYASTGDFKSASMAFQKAATLAPGNMLYYENIAKSLEFQGKTDEAVRILKSHVKLLKKLGQNRTAAQLEEYITTFKH